MAQGASPHSTKQCPCAEVPSRDYIPESSQSLKNTNAQTFRNQNPEMDPGISIF